MALNKCPRCNGTGTVQKTVRYHPDADNGNRKVVYRRVRVACPRCGGTGKIRG